VNGKRAGGEVVNESGVGVAIGSEASAENGEFLTGRLPIVILGDEISVVVIPIMNQIIFRKAEFPSGNLLGLISVCGNAESVKILFSKMEIYSELEASARATINLAHFIGPTTRLYQNHLNLVNTKLDSLAKSEDTRLQKLALELRIQISQTASYDLQMV